MTAPVLPFEWKGDHRGHHGVSLHYELMRIFLAAGFGAPRARELADLAEVQVRRPSTPSRKPSNSHLRVVR